MTTPTPNNNDDSTTVAERLPKLSEKETRIALSENNIEWVKEFMETYLQGKIHLNNGVYLQRISIETVRCVGIVDHPQAFELLSSMNATFCSEGVSVQIDPYAVVIPYIDDDEKSPEPNEDTIGMETV